MQGGRRAGGKAAAVGFDSLHVVQVEEAAAGASEVLLFRARGLLREAGIRAEVRPRSAVAVDVVEIRAALFEILREGHGLAALGDAAKFCDLGGPGRGDGFLDASKDDLRGHRVEFHVAAGWEVGEALSDALLQFLSCAAEERAEASVEAELFAVVAYEVEDGAGCLSLGAAQASAQLLEEEGWAVGGAEEEEGVHYRDVDAFVEEVHREDHVDHACGEVGQGGAAFVVWGVGPDLLCGP